MSLEISSLVMKCFPLDKRLKLLAISMADAALPCGGNIFKANMTYSTDASCSKSTVIRGIRDLLDADWLLREGDNKGGAGRTNVYRINPDWISAAHYELAQAAAERRQPRPVPVPKGVNLTPFLDDKRVSNSHEKGVKNEQKGVKNEQKGVIQVLPEHRTLNNITITPLPPEGGESVFEKVVREFPRKDVADLAASRRAFNALEARWQEAGASARDQVERMCEAIAQQRAGRQWQEQGGKFVPRLSRWLRGWGCGGEAVSVENTAKSAIKSEAQRTAEMLAEQAAQSAKAAPPPPEIAAKLAQLRGRRKAVCA